jgi:RsiW-degrading membrane proteinase PrsW (M82 family)
VIFLPFLLGFAPGLFFLWWIRRQDIYEPEPWKWVIGVFALGAFFTLLAVPLEEVGLAPLGGKIQLNGPPAKAGDWYHLFFVSFVVAGPIEELCKYAAVRFSVYRSAVFDEPLDGLVYSSAAALGFASLENVFFTFQNGPSVMLVRAPLSTLGHVFFAAMWGYSLGVHRLGIARRGTVGRGLFASMFLHGLFDFVLLTQTVLALAVLPLMAVAGRMTWLRIKEYQRISPFRERRPERLVRCPSCGGFIEETSAFCNFCGIRVEFVPENVRLHCGHCREAVAPEARFCNACGHSLIPDPGGPGPA